MVILNHIWLVIMKHYSVLDVIIPGKEEEKVYQNLVPIQNVIAHIGINQGKTSQKDLF